MTEPEGAAEARAKIEEGLRELAAAYYGPNYVLTDWIVSANTVDMEGDGNSTRYLRPSSNLPMHVAKGLLQQAIDMINEESFIETLEAREQ